MGRFRRRSCGAPAWRKRRLLKRVGDRDSSSRDPPNRVSRNEAPIGREGRRRNIRRSLERCLSRRKGLANLRRAHRAAGREPPVGLVAGLAGLRRCVSSAPRHVLEPLDKKSGKSSKEFRKIRPTTNSSCGARPIIATWPRRTRSRQVGRLSQSGNLPSPALSATSSSASHGIRPTRESSITFP